MFKRLGTFVVNMKNVTHIFFAGYNADLLEVNISFLNGEKITIYYQIDLKEQFVKEVLGLEGFEDIKGLEHINYQSLS